MNPLAIELLASDLLRDHQADARQAALAAQLPARTAATSGALPTRATRWRTACVSLAARLDPNLGAASSSRLAPVRH